MNILFINGSPKSDGNTARLLQHMFNTAQPHYENASLYHVGRMRIRGCIGCLVCNQMPACVVRDQMQELYAQILQADLLVFGFPIYMGQMPSFAKTFTDRLYAFLNPDFTSRFETPKRILWIITQGAPDPETWRPYLTETATVFKQTGFETIDTWIFPLPENTISDEIFQKIDREGENIFRRPKDFQK